MDKMLGKMLDNRYELLEIIGQGGMAVVYRAKCHRLNRMVAVKVLKDEFSGDDEFKNRFQDESLSVAMLSHPNIVSVYDVSRDGDIEYIVMELIDGITLKDYLGKKGPLTWQETTFFALQIAKALQHAHNRGIVHRDIKPQNIMLLRDGTVKVADFGIAHQVAKQHTYSRGEAIGSVHYISPEQAKGSRIDNRADIYSLGVVMYEMLTGRLPFDGASPVAVAIQHINAVPLSPRDHITEIPKSIETITMKAMNPNLSLRYSSAEELIADLDKIRNDPHIEIAMPAAPVIIEDGADGATQKINYQSDIERISKRPREAGTADDDEEEGKERPSRNYGMIFNISAILVFVLGALFLVYAVINPFAGDDKYTQTTPDLKGRLFDEVVEEYTQYKITSSETIYHETYAAGQIISQKPEADRKIAEGDEIVVVVSRGPKVSEMGDFTGKEYRQATIELERMGLIVTEEWEFSTTVERNYVIRTTPAKGEQLSENATVTLVISKGKELKNVQVPNIIGKTQADAKKAIESAGLKVGEVTVVESKEPDGQVIFQTIPAGSTVQEQTVVDFQVSKNVTPKKVAKIISLPIIQAEGTVVVKVYVNDELQYDYNHTSDENVIEVPLVGFAGANRIKIVQNDTITMDEDMVF